MAEKKFDVLTVGELNVDLILNDIDRFPEPGKEIIANKMKLTLGSSSAIFACNLSVLGATVSFCGRLGNDSFADKILADLGLKNVDVENISRSDTADTGITVALNFNDDRAMVTYPGAMNELQETQVSDAMLMSAGHLHVSSPFLQPALKPGLVRLFKRAKQAGLTISFDPQWDPSEKWDCDWKHLLPFVDVFMPNMAELKNITQKPIVEDAIDIIKDFSNIVCVKNGDEGAVIWTGSEFMYQPAFINHTVADAIGAGDSFNAGFIYKFIRQKKLSECAEFGALCGAINTVRHGGTTAFSDFDSVKKIAFGDFNYFINDDERKAGKL